MGIKEVKEVKEVKGIKEKIWRNRRNKIYKGQLKKG